jgi:signal transduction histidine kinase
MRVLLAELRPMEPEQLGAAHATESAIPGIVRLRADGLVATLSRHISDIGRDGLTIDLDARDYVPQAYEQEEALYRITQEALNNVMKHAHATRVKIEVFTDERSTRLSIRDDGVGFASVAPMADAAHKSGGIGLQTMRERAEALGGTVAVTPTPGNGTTVEVILPRRERATGE